MSDDPAELELESIERVDEGFELVHPDHDDPVTVECVTTDIDVDGIADAMADLADETTFDGDDAAPDVASAARSYNEIRPDIEALFSELADDGLVSFLGDSGPDAGTVREWRREHPETVERFEAVVGEYQTAYQQLDDVTPIMAAGNDFFDVYSDLGAIRLLIEGGADE